MLYTRLHGTIIVQTDLIYLSIFSCRKFCAKHNIFMVGFSSFGSPDLPWGEKLPHILVDETLKEIAKKHNQTTACVVLAWQVQRGVGLIPKVRENTRD